MRKWVIIVGVILLLLGGAIATALINLNSYLNKNKVWLAEQAEAALGRKVSFDEVGVSLIGGFGARLKNFHIADDATFSKEDFVRADDVQVRVKVLPALFGRYEVKRIVLGSPMVTILRDERGFNFDSIGKKREDAEAEKEKELPEEPSAGEAAQFLVSLMEIKDGEIHFVDHTSNPSTDLTIQMLDFLASDVSLTTPIHVYMAAALFDSSRQNFELETTVGPLGTPPDIQKAALAGKLKLDPLDVEALRRALPRVTRQIPPGLDLSGPVELTAQFSGSPASLSVSDLYLSASVFGATNNNLKVAGAVGPLGPGVPPSDLKLDLQVELGPVAIDKVKKLKLLGKALPPRLSSPDPVQLSATLKGSPGNLGIKAQFDGAGAAVRYGVGFVKPKDIPMKLDLDAQRSGGSIHLKSFAFRLAGLNLSGKGTILTGAETSLDLQVDSKRAPLDGWDRLFPALAGQKVSGELEIHLTARGKVGSAPLPKLTGNLALKNVNAQIKGWPHPIEGLSTTIVFKGDAAELARTKFRLGGSPVELEAKVENFKTPAITFTFQSPELRAASIGIAGKGVKKEEMARGLAVKGTYRPAGKSSAFQGAVRSSSGTMRDIDYQELQANLGLRDRVAILDKLALRAFAGTYHGSGSYDMRESETPKFDFQSSVRGMMVKGLLISKFPGAEKHIDGLLDMDIALSGSGKNWEKIQKMLRGEGRMEVKDGVLKEVNIAEGAIGGVTGISGLSNLISSRVGEKYPEIFGASDTRFETLKGTVQIDEGRARTEDLTLSARDYTILGKGTFAFVNRLDFTATFSASERLTEDVVSDAKVAKYITNEQGRLSIPFRMTGALPKVRTRPDKEFIAKSIKRGLIEGEIGKLLGGKEKSSEETGERKEKKPRPEQELIKKGLEGIFGR